MFVDAKSGTKWSHSIETPHAKGHEGGILRRA
jgi:hypothetical protein